MSYVSCKYRYITHIVRVFYFEKESNRSEMEQGFCRGLRLPYDASQKLIYVTSSYLLVGPFFISHALHLLLKHILVLHSQISLLLPPSLLGPWEKFCIYFSWSLNGIPWTAIPAPKARFSLIFRHQHAPAGVLYTSPGRRAGERQFHRHRVNKGLPANFMVTFLTMLTSTLTAVYPQLVWKVKPGIRLRT